MELIVIFFVCVLSGMLTGLLGIGGGIVILPAFLFILPLFGIDHYTTQQIVGISATCVFFNSVVTLFYRRKEKFVETKFLLKMVLWIILGTFFGVYVTHLAPKAVILLIYILVSSISLFLLKSDVHFELKNPKLKYILYLIFFGISTVSAAIGIGGAILFATVLKCFTDKNSKELLPTITLIVAVNACFVFLGKIFVGDISYLIVPVSILASFTGSKIGILISRKLKPKTITNLMIMVLVISLIEIIKEFIACFYI